MLYRITVKEVHNQEVWIEAENRDDAIMKVREAEGEDFDNGPQYDHTLDFEEWLAVEETDQRVIDEFRRWST